MPIYKLIVYDTGIFPRFLRRLPEGGDPGFPDQGVDFAGAAVVETIAGAEGNREASQPPPRASIN